MLAPSLFRRVQVPVGSNAQAVHVGVAVGAAEAGPVAGLQRKGGGAGGRYQGTGYGQFKRDLAEVVVDHLVPIQKRYRELRQSGDVERVLKAGAEQASRVAEETLTKMRDAMGLVPRMV